MPVKKKGLSSMEPAVDLCCSLYKALTLDPVPVIGNVLYVAGAEGLRLSNLTEETAKPCPAHRFNFRHTVETLLQHVSTTERCVCESSPAYSTERWKNEAPFLRGKPKTACVNRVKRGGEEAGKGDSPPEFTRRMLWAYENDNVVAAYKWLIRNRSRDYPKCCEAVIVYQLKRSQSLPPGLYVYRTQPTHFGCTAERPLAVLDQFNFGGRLQRGGLKAGLPSAIVIKMFPGCENFSALYVISRKLAISTPEYGNRMFGEARALNIIDVCSSANAILCQHHEVAMRTERMCVLDLRWKGFDTKSACIKAIPRVGGLQAVVWCNHSSEIQDIECNVLTWLFGFSNKLPREVQLIDYKREAHGVRYILMDMDTFPGSLPKPPTKDTSYFVHTYFVGDLRLATQAIGELPECRSRMGSPCPNESCFTFWYSLPSLECCQHTPFSCGVRHGALSAFTEASKTCLLEWVLQKPGTSCMGLAVQHTLYYHAANMKYKLMVSHTVMDNDDSLTIFRL